MTPAASPRRRPRTCVACREESPKRALIRVVRSPEGACVLDERGKLPGRGAYLCARRECIEKARKTKALERALKTEIPNDLYDRLAEYLETYGEKHDTTDVCRELRTLLGLSRRAGLVHIGSDSVKSQCEKESLLVLTALDRSASVGDLISKLTCVSDQRQGTKHVLLSAPLNVEELSSALGALHVQVIALPNRSGLADKIKMLITENLEREGGLALEQNESV